MIVGDLDVVRVAVAPPKADAPLIVDANAVLPDAIATEFFQSIAGGYPQVGQLLSGIQDEKLAERDVLQGWGPASYHLAVEQSFRVAVAEAADHSGNITRYVIIVKRYESSRVSGSG